MKHRYIFQSDPWWFWHSPQPGARQCATRFASAGSQVHIPSGSREMPRQGQWPAPKNLGFIQLPSGRGTAAQRFQTGLNLALVQLPRRRAF